MISIKKVNFQYFQSPNLVLKDVSLEIEEGEFIGIIGPTGCGKSTLCYLLNGLIPHSMKGYFDGNVRIMGRNTRSETVDELSNIVGYMLQEPSFQIITPNVESEIAFGMENSGIDRETMRERIDYVIKILGIKHLRKRVTSDLSEGEKQRVILASILALEPRLLVLDECSSMLDLTSKQELANTLRQLNKKQGKTIVMIEHDLDFLLDLVDRIILINDGKIIADGSTSEILTNSELIIQNDLVPPLLIQLFNDFKENLLQVEKIPSSYFEAAEILRGWLK
ncbi:MAG TPA: ATP-binding cassette domain-containing protein [candidate division Zixibacteria bacterium]|nr:ATP-binding cassette domain-containing protein [candidate division Zixibacteria bacterium]